MDIYFIILMLVFSAFFSGIEIAFFSVNKLRIALLKQQGSLSGKILSYTTESPSHFIGTTLIGNNIALIILSIFMARALEPGLTMFLPPVFQNEFSILIIQTIITTALVLIFGEFLPKALFRLNPEGSLRFFTIPLFIVYIILYPLVMLFVFISNFILRVFFRTRATDDQAVFTHIDLENFINQFIKKEESNDEINTEIFEKALYLREVRARECMIPRTEIEALDINSSIEDLRKKFAETRLSRIIIFDGGIDNILGYVHHFDLLKIPESIKEILFPIKVIPDTMLAKDILNIFMKDHKGIVWVVDEFGGTAGIVTLEDVLEEIFGEIKDEHDTEDFVERKISEDEFIFSGRLEIDFINEKYKLEIPEGDYETLAGYILSHYESIPMRGEEIIIDRFRFRILNVGETRIETVRLKIIPPASSDSVN